MTKTDNTLENRMWTYLVENDVNFCNGYDTAYLEEDMGDPPRNKTEQEAFDIGYDYGVKFRESLKD